MEDYTSKVGKACLILIAMLLVVGFIPEQSIGGVYLRHVNILSEVAPFDNWRGIGGGDGAVPEFELGDNSTSNDNTKSGRGVNPATILQIDEEEYNVDMAQVEREVKQAQKISPQSPSTITLGEEEAADIAQDIESREDVEVAKPSSKKGFSPQLKDVKLTPIEDFDESSNSAMTRLYRKLNDPKQSVRIAFMGDSFVEGDILSGDLREALQTAYGGCGAGYAPISSPLTGFRQTIKTQSSDWKSYNVMQRRKAPEDIQEDFYVSGWISRPERDGASTLWSCTTARQHVDHCGGVRLLFVSRQPSTIEVEVDGGEARTYKFKGGKEVQQIAISAPRIESFRFTVKEGAAGFVGYGAIFEGGKGGGVTLDNLSVRSNNGQAMFWTNASVNAQIGNLMGGYDLVVLQYGLNIMQRGVNVYTRYGAQIEKMVQYVRTCFPGCAVLVMGVSDRSMKENGDYKPMGEAIPMTRYQREAARNTKAAFWSTYDAMAAQGGMAKFVEQGFAGKDFTHINFKGGRQIALALSDALQSAQNAAAPRIMRGEDHGRVVSEEMLQGIDDSFKESEFHEVRRSKSEGVPNISAR